MPVAVDFETFYRKNGVPSVEQGNYAYTHHPEFSVLLISVADGSDSWAGELRDFNWDSLRDRRLVSHNAGFDRAIYRRLIEEGLAPVGLEADWQCSANLAAWSCGLRSLAQSYQYFFGEETSKAARDAMSGLTLNDLKAKGIFDSSVKYALEDSQKCIRLWNHVSPAWPAREMALSDLTILQCLRGVHVDRAKLEQGIHALQEAIQLCERALPWFPDKPATSPKGIAQECLECGIPGPPIKSHDGGEEAFAAWELAFADDFGWVRRVGDWRSMTKVLAGLENIRDRIRPDGRFDFSLLYYGAHTGRFSGSGGFNMQNLRKFPLTIDRRTGQIIPESEAKTLRGEKRTDGIAHIDTRGMFVPGPGMELFSSDFAQIEPRVLAWCAGNIGLLAMAEQGISVYEAYARNKGIWSGATTLKSADLALYTAIKAKVLQLGYQSGPETYRIKCAEDGIEYSEEEAKKHVDEYRAENPEVVKLWRYLDNLFKGSVGKDFELELPDGSALRYQNVQRTLTSYKKDPITGEPIKKWIYSAQVGHRRMGFYGGKLTENLVQSIARHVMAEGMLRVERAGFPVLWSIHDELITESPAGQCRPEELREILRVRPDWLKECPLDAESERIDRYKK